METLQGFERVTQWVAALIPGAIDKLDASTPCDEWNVRTLLDHLVSTNEYFAASARGETPSLPVDPPAERIGNDPVVRYDESRAAAIDAFGSASMSDSLGASIGIATADQLVHGWDLATATGQDATMPAELADLAYTTINGRLTDKNRGRGFKAAIPVPSDADPQTRLLAYTGRRPSSIATA